MYKELSFSRRRKQKGKIVAFMCFLVIVAVLWIAALLMSIRAMAAPEVSEGETVPAGAEAGMVSANEIVNEIVYVDMDPGLPMVAIDPGHGGEDGGCVSGAVLEKEINLQIAKRLESKLLEQGCQVVMIRSDDISMTKEQRVETANQYQADIYISIHQNSYEDHQANGVETWYYGEDSLRDSEKLARLIHEETIKSTGAAERELRNQSDFYVTGHTAMPACLVETGFLSHTKEKANLISAEYQEKIAAGIAEGIRVYFQP